MSSKVVLRLVYVVGVMYFLQLAGVLYVLLSTAGSEQEVVYTVYGPKEVGSGSDVFVRVEASRVGSGKLISASGLSLVSDYPVERHTVRTSSGPVDIVKIQDVSEPLSLQTEIALPGIGAVTASIPLVVHEDYGWDQLWNHSRDFRKHHSVVSGYEQEGVSWADIPMDDEAAWNLHVSVTGGTLQAFHHERAWFYVTDLSGSPVSNARIQLTRGTVGGQQQEVFQTNSLGLAERSMRLRGNEDWRVEITNGPNSQHYSARVVPARDGMSIRVSELPVFEVSSQVSLDIYMPGSHMYGYLTTRCSDGSMYYQVVSVPEEESWILIETPPSLSERPRICVVTMSATGYEGSSRDVAAYITGVSPSGVGGVLSMLMRGAGRRMEPHSRSSAWMGLVDKLEETSDSSAREMGVRFLLSHQPLTDVSLRLLWTSQPSVEERLQRYGVHQGKRLRVVMIIEVFALLCLLAVVLIPGIIRSRRALREFEEDSLEPMRLSWGTIVVFCGLLLMVIVTAMGGIVYLFSIMGG